MTTSKTSTDGSASNATQQPATNPLNSAALSRASVDTLWSRIPLPAPTADTLVTGMACVRGIESRQDRNGGTYLLIDIGHRDARTRLKIWASDTPRWSTISQGDAVQLTLRGKPGRGTWPPEWSVEEVSVQPADHPIRDDLLPACPIPEPELEERWVRLVGELSPSALALLNAVLDTVGTSVYRRAPAAERMHHAVAPHGLWWHSIEVGEGALALARAIPTYASSLSTDVLVLGALLHDIGKTREYLVVPGVGIQRSPVGTARYHTTLGIEIVTAAVHQHRGVLHAAAVPQWLIDAVTHVIESHHSKPEWGSPSAPASREAWVLHLADMTSATLQSMSAALEGATPLDVECWFRPLDSRGRLVLRYPPNIETPSAPTPNPTPLPPDGERATCHDGSAAPPTTRVANTNGSRAEAETRINRQGRVLPFPGAREPKPVVAPTDAALVNTGATRLEPVTPSAIGLPIPGPSSGGRITISVHEQDLRLLLVAAGLTVLAHSADQKESKERLRAIGGVLISVLDSHGQAAVRTSMRALRAAGRPTGPRSASRVLPT